MDNHLIRVRVTGVLIEGGEILLVKQKVSAERGWSLPGGKLEQGESIENAIRRELFEETGLTVEVVRLLYICDKPEAIPSLVHITLLLRRVSGEIRMPTNEYETTPIHDIRMVPLHKLTEYGFTEHFMNIVLNNFPDAGSYMGHKKAIGLD